ncbi:DDE-domain-containing protein, partial [Amniculicola lignicola CBS 123094]
LSKCWVTRFIKRHDLAAIYAPTLDANRAYNHDPKTIDDFFKLLKSTKRKHWPQPANMWNMDKKGCMLGQAQAAKVVVGASTTQKKRAFIQQPGNQELVTAIECVSAAGVVIDPLIVFKGKFHQDKWVQMDGGRSGWSYALSQKGWTDDELGLEWLKIFEQATRPALPREKRLLIMDNHGSHLTGKFLRFAIDHKIIVLCFPPHTTHLLQPLDVGLFGPLQTHYTKLVAAAVRFGGVGGVDKALFLEYYHEARELAFTKDNIERAWANTGLHPL